MSELLLLLYVKRCGFTLLARDVEVVVVEMVMLWQGNPEVLNRKQILNLEQGCNDI